MKRHTMQLSNICCQYKTNTNILNKKTNTKQNIYAVSYNEWKKVVCEHFVCFCCVSVVCVCMCVIGPAVLLDIQDVLMPREAPYAV